MSSMARVEPASDRPGLNIMIGEGDAPVTSPTWTLGGWRIRFVRLGPYQSIGVDQSEGAVHAKVVTGRLAGPDMTAYAAPKVVRDTRVTGDHVQAGPEGAVFAEFVATANVPTQVVSMDQLVYDGPFAERLRFQTFEEKFAGLTTAFDGADAHASPGFHLLDDDGAEIAYVWVWTAGKGVDMTTHNHGRAPGPTSPAFAEVHWVLHNGTGHGGMYETPEPGSPERDRYVLVSGQEHGPFFAVDATTGLPRLRDNGAVEYPWHGWEAGTDDDPGQAFDVVAAFEITADHALVLG